MDHNRGRFSTLLVTLIITLMTMPLLDKQLKSLPIVQIAFTAIFVAGVYALSRHRGVLIRGVALAVTALGLTWWRQMTPSASPALSLANYGVDVIFFGYVVVVVLRTILADQRVSADTIYGGISVYLLIGFIWTVFFSAIEYFTPGSFMVGDVAVSALQSDFALETPLFHDLLYFSFVTMTTLGYGDIRPASDLAQAVSVAEAIVGQLFVAIFIARLVGLHLVHATREDMSSGGGTGARDGD